MLDQATNVLTIPLKNGILMCDNTNVAVKHILLIILLPLFAGSLAAQDPEIVGGTNVLEGKYPFMVGVIYADESNLFKAMNCGASLIGSKWVMTAAHCVTSMDPDEVHILINTVDLFSPTVHTKRIKVKSIHINPEYGRKYYEIRPGIRSSVPDNDIALLELSEEVNAPTVGIPTVDDDAYNLHGLGVRVMGWGKKQPSGPNEKAAILQEADIFIIDRSICQTYEYYDQLVTDDILCAGQLNPGNPIGGADGDSGGPLVIQDNDGWTQIGIMSWGRGITNFQRPGAYQKVAPFASWIQNLIGLKTSTQEWKGGPIVVKTLPFSYVISLDQQASDIHWIQATLDGRILHSGVLRPDQKDLEVPILNSQPTVVRLSTPDGTWSQVLR